MKNSETNKLYTNPRTQVICERWKAMGYTDFGVQYILNSLEFELEGRRPTEAEHVTMERARQAIKRVFGGVQLAAKENDR